jgi:Mrp family chromosome partitioning ATPase
LRQQRRFLERLDRPQTADRIVGIGVISTGLGGQMGKVIVVTSGKGGVGKTTSTAALGAALARGGYKVVVVDFDVGLRNLDLVMGGVVSFST